MGSHTPVSAFFFFLGGVHNSGIRASPTVVFFSLFFGTGVSMIYFVSCFCPADFALFLEHYIFPPGFVDCVLTTYLVYFIYLFICMGLV